MMLRSWILEILDAIPCSGSHYRQSQEKTNELDDDDRTWCSTKWIGGVKATLRDDATLVTKGDDYTLATRDDLTVATSGSEKS